MKTYRKYLIGFSILLVLAVVSNPILNIPKEKLKSISVHNFEKSTPRNTTYQEYSLSRFENLLLYKFVNLVPYSAVCASYYMFLMFAKCSYNATTNSIGAGDFIKVILSNNVSKTIIFSNEKFLKF